MQDHVIKAIHVNRMRLLIPAGDRMEYRRRIEMRAQDDDAEFTAVDHFDQLTSIEAPGQMQVAQLRWIAHNIASRSKGEARFFAKDGTVGSDNQPRDFRRRPPGHRR